MLRAIVRDAFYRSTAIRPALTADLSSKWLHLVQLRQFLDTHEINVVLDVGANEGQFAAKLRRLAYRGLILSFEPDPRAFSVLSARHSGDDNWRGYPYALGDENGSLPFHLANDSVLSSALRLIRDENITETVSVPVRRLDDVWSEIMRGLPAPRVLLKTDTQGFDLAVLRGAREVFAQVSGLLVELSVLPIYEHSPKLTDALEAYKLAGFDLIELTTINRTPDGRLLELDGLFVNRGLVAKNS